jgi:hypothetical protein
MEVLNVDRYGCEECGAVGWRREGESIVQTGEDGGVPVVTRIVHEPNAAESSWMAECGHRVRPASALERFFSALAPGEVAALPPNG